MKQVNFQLCIDEDGSGLIVWSRSSRSALECLMLKKTEVDGAGELDFSCTIDSGYDVTERVLRCSRLGKFGKAPPKKLFHFKSSGISRREIQQPGPL